MSPMSVEQGTIVVQAAPSPRAAQRLAEICEHKGIGHPDTIADGVCEAAAVALARAYQECFGRILHFNVDKGLIVGGRSEPHFGGGRVLEHAKLIVCGRASNPGGRLDIGGIVAAAARQWLDRHLHAGAGLFRIVSEVREGSASLNQVYAANGQARRANDTSVGVGFAPFSELERQVLHMAETVRSEAFRRRFPAAGDDFKVMGLRVRDGLSLTVALALIDRYVSGPREYFALKSQMRESLLVEFPAATQIDLNALDDPDSHDESGLHLTVTGLSAEVGDDGQVGRGNRVNGLITPGRPMSLEAAAGKNPVAHVGKIYSVLANVIARAVCAQLDEVEEASVQLLSTIGHPLDQPRIAVVDVTTRGALSRTLMDRVTQIARQELDDVAALTARLTLGEIDVY
jgi:S-adenosylmethionine synthetase